MIAEGRVVPRGCSGRLWPAQQALRAQTGGPVAAHNALVPAGRHALAFPLVSGLGGFALLHLAAGSVLANGGEVLPPPDLESFLLWWRLDPQVTIPLLVAGAAYLWAVRRVNAAHPANPVPVDRPLFWFAGLAAIAIALLSGIKRYDSELFSVHMVQHLLILFGAGMLVLGAPVTLLLRAATPAIRERWILPVLRSRPVKVMAHPVVAWLLFTMFMWGSHVSPLYGLMLENDFVHNLSHALYLGTALLFWWPVTGRDPTPWRMPYPARIGYLFLQMPVNSFLGVVILFSDRVLYPYYLTTGRTWPPTPLEDQQLAGAIMWGVGDLGFLISIFVVVAAWMRSEEAATRRREAVEDGRAARLAAAARHGDGQQSPVAGDRSS
jgi:putative copper resistance protein D